MQRECVSQSKFQYEEVKLFRKFRLKLWSLFHRHLGPKVVLCGVLHESCFILN